MLLPLSSPLATLENSGGKGSNLSRLIRLGYPVPKGLIITTEAYQAFVDANHLDRVIQENLASKSMDSPLELEEISAGIRSRFTIGQIPVELDAAMREAYESMGHPAVAVRSSATAEDLPEVSFAGQQETFLNIVGETALITAIVSCWSSLWTARAIGYRLRNDIPQAGLGLAVVIQEMIPSQASGVAFTANPLTGLRTCTVIDATLGLGEALVSGKVEPDHYEVDGSAGKILLKSLGKKSYKMYGQEGGGLLTRQDEARQVQALPDSQILALADLCARVQNDFGFPQDIEWAWAADQLYLLQSRPITSLFPTPEGMPLYPLRTMFSFAAVQGVLDPFTPLGQDGVRIALTGLSALFGYKLKSDQSGFLFVAGERLWLAITSLVKNRTGRGIIQGVLSMVEPNIKAQLDGVIDDPLLRAEGGPRLQTIVHLFRFLAPLLPRVLLAFLFPGKRQQRSLSIARRALSSIRQQSEAVQGDEYQKLLQRTRLLLEMRKSFLRNLPPYFVAPMAAGMVSLNLTNQILAKTLGSTSGDLAGMKEVMFRLTRGLPNNVTTEMDLFLWTTAKIIRKDPDSARLFTSQSSQDLAEAFLKGLLPEVSQTAIQHFLESYGMRGPGEIDLGRPRWWENPVQIMKVLASYLQITDETRAPDAVFQAGANEAREEIDQLERQIRQLHGGWIKARLFRFAIRRVRALLGLRESPKFFIVRIMGIMRLNFLESGRDLVKLGVLDHPEDIFFLRIKDLEALAGHQSGDWRDLVRRNRANNERESRRRQIPVLLLSDGRAFYAGVEDAESDNRERLSGTPVSAGSVEGRVRVIFSPYETSLLPGEILVCPGTDPAWTPLFLSAGGLIMEVGGMMTHGAVVAREYGIPAVVGVAQATRRLKTGQLVRLDGTQGSITILAQA